jgi:hypothetical protein
MFDIGTIVETDCGTIELRHPETNASLGASITLAGPGHPKRKKVEFARARALRARVAKRGRLELTDPEEDEEYEIDRLASCTLAWEGICQDGKPIPCTPDEVRSLYESASWVRVQVAAFLDDRVNFIKSSDAASANA